MHTAPINVTREVEALLAGAGLPTSDLPGSRSLNLLGFREGGHLVGVIGVEIYGQAGMLRSLAVDPTHRLTGLGTALVLEAETFAAGRGITALYLLTTTAAGFFTKLGYETIARSEAPVGIADTAQFTALCPASSAFMRKVIPADEKHPSPHP